MRQAARHLARLAGAAALAWLPLGCEVPTATGPTAGVLSPWGSVRTAGGVGVDPASGEAAGLVEVEVGELLAQQVPDRASDGWLRVTPTGGLSVAAGDAATEVYGVLAVALLGGHHGEWHLGAQVAGLLGSAAGDRLAGGLRGALRADLLEGLLTFEVGAQARWVENGGPAGAQLRFLFGVNWPMITYPWMVDLMTMMEPDAPRIRR